MSRRKMVSSVYSMTWCIHTVTNEHDGKGQVVSSHKRKLLFVSWFNEEKVILGRTEMFSLMKSAPQRRSNEVGRTEPYYGITGDEMQEDNMSKKRKKMSTWPKGSWALRRGEVETLRTEEGEVVGGAGGCWEEEEKEEGVKLEDACKSSLSLRSRVCIYVLKFSGSLNTCFLVLLASLKQS